MRILTLILVCLLAGCGLPRDPQGTLEGVRDATVRVGIASNPPWTHVGAAGVNGVEVELLRRFADDLNARIEWVPGTEAELFEALEQWQLDAVVAGLAQDNPWLTEVGVSRPYYKSALIIGVPVDWADQLGDFAGQEVAVSKGRVTAGYVKALGAIPVPVENVSKYPGPIAAHRWQIEAWGYRPTDVVLHRAGHVIAVPPGENAWLMQLDRFLYSRRKGMHELLMAQQR